MCAVAGSRDDVCTSGRLQPWAADGGALFAEFAPLLLLLLLLPPRARRHRRHRRRRNRRLPSSSSPPPLWLLLIRMSVCCQDGGSMERRGDGVHARQGSRGPRSRCGARIRRRRWAVERAPVANDVDGTDIDAGWVTRRDAVRSCSWLVPCLLSSSSGWRLTLCVPATCR